MAIARESRARQCGKYERENESRNIAVQVVCIVIMCIADVKISARESSVRGMENCYKWNILIY
jgi:hypothetical protein